MPDLGFGEPLMWSLAVSPDSFLSIFAVLIAPPSIGFGPILSMEFLLETCNLPWVSCIEGCGPWVSVFSG